MYLIAKKVTVTSNVTVTSGADAPRQENITNWALAQFQKRYGRGTADGSTVNTRESPRRAPMDGRTIPYGHDVTKTDIFHYVYAVFHHPAYRAKYKQNLKASFPESRFTRISGNGQVGASG